jgi:hypothetical protein
VTSEQRQEWLRRYEAGESAAKIAQSANVDVRTVRRHIDEARQEKEIREARLTVLRSALEQHYSDLVELAKNLDSQVAREERVPTSLRENPMWLALKQHLPRSPLWSYLNKWENMLNELAALENNAKNRLKAEVESRPALSAASSAGMEAAINGIASALVFHMKSAARGSTVLNVDKDLIAEPAGEGLFDIRYGFAEIGRANKEQFEVIRETLKDMESEIVKWEEYSNFQKLFGELDHLKKNLRDELAVIILRRIVPGRCIYCPI